MLHGVKSEKEIAGSVDRAPRSWIRARCHRRAPKGVRVTQSGMSEQGWNPSLVDGHRTWQSSLGCPELDGPLCEVHERASGFGALEGSDTTRSGLTVTARYSWINPHGFCGADKHRNPFGEHAVSPNPVPLRHLTSFPKC